MNNFPTIAAVVIFVGAFALIVSEKVHRTKVSSLGAALLFVLGIVTLDQAWHDYIDFQTLGLLLGMMILVNITRRTGVFEFVALRIARWTGGNYTKILIGFAIITAVFSAFLDNVTTVLLIAPISLYIADLLGQNPRPLLMVEILASNIGGAATLIGDPPNVLIGSAVGLGFMDFLTNLAPIIIVILVVNLFYARFIFRHQLRSNPIPVEKLAAFEEERTIRDKALLVKSGIVLGLTLLAFMLHDLIGVSPATVALIAAAVLTFISKQDVEELLQEVEWPTLFFFGGLFVLVGGLEATGITTMLAGLIAGSGSSLLLLAVVILWGSAILSGFLDNIPFVAAMIPLLMNTIAQLGLTTAQAEPLWWALSLGACLGGNGTLIGASANLIIAGVSQKTRDPINFRNYFKVGMTSMLISVTLATGYIYLRYFL